MGIQRDSGYSASVEGYLVVDGTRFRLAKSNANTLVLAEGCELPPETNAELLIIVDGDHDSKQISIPDGIGPGEHCVRYTNVAPV